MATPSGAIRQWQSLPFPVRLAGIFLAGMAMIWLTRWLGGISVLVALLLWCAVGIGLVHASGRLAWVHRYPWAARILQGFAPRFAVALPAAGLATACARAPPQPGEPPGVITPRFVTYADGSRAFPAVAAAKRVLGILQKLKDEMRPLVVAVREQHAPDSADIGPVLDLVLFPKAYIIHSHGMPTSSCALLEGRGRMIVAATPFIVSIPDFSS